MFFTRKVIISLLIGLPLLVFSYTGEDVSVANNLAQRGIIVNQSHHEASYRLDEPISRSEMLGIALKMAQYDLPEGYACQNYFTDTQHNSSNNWICRSAEIGADAGIVTRRFDKPPHQRRFRPSDSVTRAESLAIILQSMGIQIPNNESSLNTSYILTFWQKNLYLHAQDLGVLSTINQDPNSFISRAEAFSFIQNVFNNWGQITSERQYIGDEFYGDFYHIYKNVDGQMMRLGELERKSFQVLGGGFFRDEHSLYLFIPSSHQSLYTENLLNTNTYIRVPITTLDEFTLVDSTPGSESYQDSQFIYTCSGALQSGARAYQCQQTGFVQVNSSRSNSQATSSQNTERNDNWDGKTNYVTDCYIEGSKYNSVYCGPDYDGPSESIYMRGAYRVFGRD